MKEISFLCLYLICMNSLVAQNRADNSTYNSHELFSQKFNPSAGNTFRSVNGTPGSA